MNAFSVLTNRKRVLIALVHSVVFLGIAMHGFAAPKPALSLHGPGAAAGLTSVLICATVALVLLRLACVAGCTKERVYFALCAGSASFGLLRTWFGDAGLPEAQYLRVFLLTYAALIGAWILRSHPEQMVAEQESVPDGCL